MRTSRPRPSPNPAHGASASKATQVARSAPQEVRIIGGQFKRSPLQVPTWPGLRPTPSRVRETLFNWLGQDLTDWQVLDAFAGTGALGLEAASRGAARVVAVERETVLARQIQANAQRLGASQVTVQTADALTWMRHQAAQHPAGAFDLALIDPPFESDLFDVALAAATACVAIGGWVYLESNRPQAPSPALRLHRQDKAGAVHFHLFERMV
jgi:16S rRNA (guanine966-N2)-methyltransferase